MSDIRGRHDAIRPAKALGASLPMRLSAARRMPSWALASEHGRSMASYLFLDLKAAGTVERPRKWGWILEYST